MRFSRTLGTVPRFILAVALLAGIRAAAADLPPGLPDVTLGMTQEALLASRPDIHRKNYAGTTVPAARPNNSWNEYLGPEHWPYRFARFDVKGGVLVGVFLHGDAKPEELSAARLQATASARTMWGQDYTAEIETYGFVTAPVAVWTKADRVVRLFLSPKPAKIYVGSTNISLDVRLASERRAPQTETVIPAAKRAQLFEECGVEDRRPAAPAELGFDELKAAPLSVLIDGREVALSAYLRREFAKSPAQDGEPLTADFTVVALDGKPFPAGLRFDAAWVLRGQELWRVPPLTTRGENRGSPELRASATGGPRWGGRTNAVVRLIDRDGRAVLLAAPGRDIVFGNFH